MTIISVGSFWAVNHVGGFCLVLAQIEMIMINEMILSYAANVTVNCFKNNFHSQNSLVMDGSA